MQEEVYMPARPPLLQHQEALMFDSRDADDSPPIFRSCGSHAVYYGVMESDEYSGTYEEEPLYRSISTFHCDGPVSYGDPAFLVDNLEACSACPKRSFSDVVLPIVAQTSITPLLELPDEVLECVLSFLSSHPGEPANHTASVHTG